MLLTVRLLLLTFLALPLPFLVADAAPTQIVRKPSDLIFVEAEEMTTDGTTWKVQPHSKGDYYGYPSGLKMLRGNDGSQGTATKQVEIAKAGRYRVWVRYLDIGHDRREWPFQVRLLQQGNAVAEKGFDTVWLRATPEGKKKWGEWARDFVWDSFEADLKAGPCAIELSKLPPIEGGTWRWVDCIAITSDANYEPHIRDFARPIYAKVVMGRNDNPKPVLIHIWGQVGHYDISRRGISPGAMNGYPPETWLNAGDESPWVDIAPILTPSDNNVVRFDALTGYIVPAPTADFALWLSRTPSQEGVIHRFHRAGKGAGMIVVLDQTTLEDAASGIESSRTLRRAVERLPRARGRQPREFPLITGLSHDPAYTPAAVIENDLATLQSLGFSGVANSLVEGDRLRRRGLKFNSSQCTTYWLLKDLCLNQPRWDEIRRYQAENLARYGEGDVQWIKLMDEIYSVHVEHLQTCPVCAEKFGEFLRERGLPPAKPVVDKNADPKMFYYTMLFRSQTQVHFLKGCTEIVRGLRASVDTIANATTELTSHKNLLLRGTDWFALYKQQALTFGFVQDANALTPSQQTISYMMDFLRSACKYHDQPYGLYNMISRTPWDIGAKAFAEVGHGARLIDFYNWGPHYADTSDPQSHRAELYPVLKEFNHAVGAVEKELLQAKPVPSKLALLYSHTTDLWDLGATDWASDRQVFGEERMCLHLLLSHLGYPLDVLTEDDVLEGRAASYEAIFVTGPHLKDGVLPKLLDWTKSGGFLYLGAGAAERNQFNQPARALEEIGLRREAFVFKEVPGHELQLPSMQVLSTLSWETNRLEVVSGYQKPTVESGRMIATFADGSPGAAELIYGQGRVVFLGFFPGLSYARSGCIGMVKQRAEYAKQNQPLITWNPRSYPVEYHRLFRRLLEPVRYQPPVRISHPLVEGCFLTGPASDVLVLANWSGEPQMIEVSVPRSGSKNRPVATIGRASDLKREGQTLHFRLRVERGDFIVLR
jgi:hypothetical protein